MNRFSLFLGTAALVWLGTVAIAAAQDAERGYTDNSPAVERGYVDVSEEGRLYYEAVGEGEPVMLLHGHSLDLRMWDPQIDTLLAEHYRVIRPEMRGYGHSSSMREGLHCTHLDDIMTLADSLHLDRFHVVGLSMGSFVASEMVALHPDRLLSATLASGNIRKRPGPSTPIDRGEEMTARQTIAANQALGIDTLKARWIEQLVRGGGSQSEQIRASITQQILDWDGWQYFNMEGRLYYANEAWDTLRVRCPQVPTLILSGDHEGKTRPNPMLQYLPNGRQEVIEDCGHMSNMERPEQFNRLLIEHLNHNKTN